MSARAKLTAALLVAAAIFNLVPGIIAIDPTRSVAAYGIALEGDTLLVLMRHRAVLLFLLGALLIAAAFRPAWRVPAIASAVVSKVTFIGFHAAAAAPTAEVGRVAALDVAALVILALAVWSGWRDGAG